MKRAPTVTLRIGRKSLWGGSLTDFMRENAFDREERRHIALSLRARGRAHIGGGAAPEFTLTTSGAAR